MTGLVKYDAACRAVAECKAIDEALRLRELALFAKFVHEAAANKPACIDAAEIVIRCERRIGQLLTLDS